LGFAAREDPDAPPDTISAKGGPWARGRYKNPFYPYLIPFFCGEIGPVFGWYQCSGKRRKRQDIKNGQGQGYLRGEIRRKKTAGKPGRRDLFFPSKPIKKRKDAVKEFVIRRDAREKGEKRNFAVKRVFLFLTK